MSEHREKIDKECEKCNSHLIMVHVKNCFIDDFEYECSNATCKDFYKASAILSRRTRQVAKSEGN